LLGLGDPSKPVRGFIEKAQAPVNKAIDWVINLAVKGLRTVGGLVAQAGAPQDPAERVKAGAQAAATTANRFAGKKVGALILNPLLGAIRIRYALKTLEVVPRGNLWAVHATVNPEAIAFTRVIVGTDPDTGAETPRTIVDPPKVLVFEFRRFTANQRVSFLEMTEGLQHHQDALNALTVDEWLANINFRAFLKGAIAAEERDIARKRLIQELRTEIQLEYQVKGITLSKSQLDGLIKLRSRSKHASHDADAIAGGNIDDFEGLERGAVNSYVGSNWGRFRPELEAYANRLRQLYEPADRKKVHMNFRLRPKFLN
jgi:hypothetical protein